MENEATKNADEHHEYIEFVVTVFGRAFSNVVAQIGDNTSTNRSLLGKFWPVFVGCPSHSYNLVFKYISRDHDELTQKVNVIMSKLSYSIPVGLLWRHRPPAVKRSNTTRRRSIFLHIAPIQSIRDVFTNVEHLEIREIVLTNVYDDDSDLFLEPLMAFFSVTVELQSEIHSFSEARLLFDEPMDKYLNLKDRLGAIFAIVENPTFEDGIRKVQRAEESSLKELK